MKESVPMRRRLPARRTVAGFVAAPPAVGLAAGLVIPKLFLLVAIVATLIAAIATVFLGLPTYFVLRAMEWKGRLVHIACGAVLGVVVALFSAGALDVSLASVDGLTRAASGAVICAPLGALAAFVFWTIARPDRVSGPRDPSR